MPFIKNFGQDGGAKDGENAPNDGGGRVGGRRGRVKPKSRDGRTGAPDYKTPGWPEPHDDDSDHHLDPAGERHRPGEGGELGQDYDDRQRRRQRGDGEAPWPEPGGSTGTGPVDGSSAGSGFNHEKQFGPGGFMHPTHGPWMGPADEFFLGHRRQLTDAEVNTIPPRHRKYYPGGKNKKTGKRTYHLPHSWGGSKGWNTGRGNV